MDKHRLEAFTDGVRQGMAEAVGAPDGWQLGLRCFTEFVAK